MRIGLHDAEKEYMKRKTFPNYALMKISAYHKAVQRMETGCATGHEQTCPDG